MQKEIKNELEKIGVFSESVTGKSVKPKFFKPTKNRKNKKFIDKWKKERPPFESIQFKPHELATVVSAFMLPLHWILQKEKKNALWRIDMRLYKVNRESRPTKPITTYSLINK
jgi:hypothetical protein